jgi:hypothetical protein
MRAFLKRPYPIEKSAERRLLAAVLFGLFVFAFLFFFKPFGIDALPDRTFFISLVFGMICTAVMLFFSFVVTELFPSYFAEPQWNVGREIGWSAMHVLFIGFFNMLFALSLSMGEFSFGFLLQYLLYTLALGIFPVTISVLVTEMQLNRKYRGESQTLTHTIAEHPSAIDPGQKEIVLESDNKDEDLSVNPDALLVLAAADNYVEVHFQREGELRKHLLRTTMKNLEEDLSSLPDLMRVHKSFIVNLANIDKVSGNAQGYKLHVDGYADAVPVARKNNQEFRERIKKLNV